jgi:sporulation protein YlmC with PRC-barrel domain
MSRILAKNLIGLPVYTQSGTHLGKVADIELDVDGHTVTQYYVATGTVVHQLLTDKPDLIVNPAQVISITAEKMIVTDLLDKNIVTAAQPA